VVLIVIVSTVIFAAAVASWRHFLMIGSSLFSVMGS